MNVPHVTLYQYGPELMRTDANPQVAEELIKNAVDLILEHGSRAIKFVGSDEPQDRATATVWLHSGGEVSITTNHPNKHIARLMFATAFERITGETAQ